MAEGSIVLAAALRPVGACDAATFALLGNEAPASKVSGADDATSSRALAAFRALSSYAHHAEEYLTFAKESESTVAAPSWDRHAESSARVSSVSVGKDRLVWVTAGADGGCGDFSAELSVLFRETNEGLEVVRVIDGFSSALEGVLASGEGYELVFPEAHVGAALPGVDEPDAADAIERLEVRTFGCRC